MSFRPKYVRLLVADAGAKLSCHGCYQQSDRLVTIGEYEAADYCETCVREAVAMFETKAAPPASTSETSGAK
jgi:hypothetical protein